MRPHRLQPTRLPRPWDSPGKNTGVGRHLLLQRIKVKGESEVAQSCLTPSNPMDCSPPGSSIRGLFQARVLEWGAIAFSIQGHTSNNKIRSQAPIASFTAPQCPFSGKRRINSTQHQKTERKKTPPPPETRHRVTENRRVKESQG